MSKDKVTSIKTPDTKKMEEELKQLRETVAGQHNVIQQQSALIEKLKNIIVARDLREFDARVQGAQAQQTTAPAEANSAE